MISYTREEYLELIGDWQDPNPKPILEEHEGFMVVRDDLLYGGTKARVADFLIQSNPHVEEWGYGGSPANGYAQISLSVLCEQYNKKLVLFMAERKPENYTKNQKLALKIGADVRWTKMGFLSHTIKLAADYVNEKPGVRKLVPFGVDDPTVIASFIRIGEDIDYNPLEVWTVAASGTLSRGLQMVWPYAEHFVVEVGHKLQLHEIGKAWVFRHALKFDQIPPEDEMPPYPSEPTYDAKVWSFVKKHAKPGALVWNVA